MFPESCAAVLDNLDLGAWSTPSVPPKVVSSDPLILLVDDDQNLREFVATMLRRENYRVSLARDGVEALEKACQMGPSVIVMDLCLPRLDGYSVIRLLKADQRTCDIRIVAVTGYGDEADAGDRAWNAGCDAFFEKPIPLDRFPACVRRLADEPA